jgi:hypothetical protein
MTKDRIVAVGLLTERDVQVLGQGFDRLFPLESIEGFEDLLAQLDAVDPTGSPLPPQKAKGAKNS